MTVRKKHMLFYNYYCNVIVCSVHKERSCHAISPLALLKRSHWFELTIYQSSHVWRVDLPCLWPSVSPSFRIAWFFAVFLSCCSLFRCFWEFCAVALQFWPLTYQRESAKKALVPTSGTVFSNTVLHMYVHCTVLYCNCMVNIQYLEKEDFTAR